MTDSLLFVCAGNTCRSPLAQVIARKLFVSAGREDILVASAGVSAIDGSGASSGALEIARQHGLDLENFQSQRITEALLESASLVVLMETSQRPAVLSLWPRADMKTFLLGSLAGAVGAEAQVPDPFGGSLESYRRTYSKIEHFLTEGLEEIFAKMRSRADHF